MITFPKDAYVIVNPDNIAARGTKNLIMMMGALPTPTTLGGFKGFSDETPIDAPELPMIHIPTGKRKEEGQAQQDQTPAEV